MFIGEIRKIDPRTGVATIAGEDLRPSGIGTVKWSWYDDEGKTHNFFLEKKLFFPTSPVNILSVSRLADHFDDDERTSTQTRRHYSIQQWKCSILSLIFEPRARQKVVNKEKPVLTPISGNLCHYRT